MTSYGNYKESYSVNQEIDEDGKKYVFDIDTVESLDQILNIFPIVVVDVWADWCNPCKLILPKYINLAVKYKHAFEQKQIIFLKDEAKKDEFFIHKNDVNVVPTFILYFYKKKYILENFQQLDEFIQDAFDNIV